MFLNRSSRLFIFSSASSGSSCFLSTSSEHTNEVVLRTTKSTQASSLVPLDTFLRSSQTDVRSSRSPKYFKKLSFRFSLNSLIGTARRLANDSGTKARTYLSSIVRAVNVSFSFLLFRKSLRKSTKCEPPTDLIAASMTTLLTKASEE